MFKTISMWLKNFQSSSSLLSCWKDNDSCQNIDKRILSLRCLTIYSVHVKSHRLESNDASCLLKPAVLPTILSDSWRKHDPCSCQLLMLFASCSCGLISQWVSMQANWGSVFGVSSLCGPCGIGITVDVKCFIG